MNEPKEYEAIWARKNTKRKIKSLAAELGYKSMLDLLDDIALIPKSKLKEILK